MSDEAPPPYTAPEVPELPEVRHVQLSGTSFVVDGSGKREVRVSSAQWDGWLTAALRCT